MKENGLKCMAMNNIGQFAIQVFVLFFIKFVVYGVAKSLRPKILPFLTNKQKEKMIKQGKEIPSIKPKQGFPLLLQVVFLYLDDRMDYAFYWAVFSSMQVDLFLGAHFKQES